MLVELKVVEQRYRAVIDAMDRMDVTEVVRLNGVAARPCTFGSVVMHLGGWRHWSTRAPSFSAVRIRWIRTSRPGFSSCVTCIQAGDSAPSAPSWLKKDTVRCPDFGPSIALWCAITASIPPSASGRALIASAGSDHARWSSGRSTSSGAFTWPTAPSSRWSVDSTTTVASVCPPA